MRHGRIIKDYEPGMMEIMLQINAFDAFKSNVK